jgi:hypothetical protein
MRPKLNTKQSEYRENYKNKLFVLGLCITCREPKETERNKNVHCLKCSQKFTEINKKKRLGRIENKCCVDCGSKKIINEFSILKTEKELREFKCYECYLKKLARQYLNGNTDWDLLHKLFVKQKGHCKYSGLPIRIGINAHLDHIIPSRSKTKRKTTIENLQWLNVDVNYMKRALSEERFIKLCRLISMNNSV